MCRCEHTPRPRKSFEPLHSHIYNGQVKDLFEGNNILHDAKVHVSSITSRTDDRDRTSKHRTEPQKQKASNPVVLEENSETGCQHSFGRGNGIGRSSRFAGLAPTILGMASRPDTSNGAWEIKLSLSFPQHFGVERRTRLNRSKQVSQ